jgi:hypothetical protein
MATNFATYTRLEPSPHEFNLEAGFEAAIYDPVWFLGRQWQMGEHQGENASSPIWVNYSLRSRAIASVDPRFDPTITPAEVIVESEIDDWWTMGRRVRIGKRLATTLPALQEKEDLLFVTPQPPYEHFEGQVDGRAVWRKRQELGIGDDKFGAEIPADSPPLWNSEEMLYQQNVENAFVAADQRLIVQRHRGGRMDWHSIDASPFAEGAEAMIEACEAIPLQLQYPGAPANRWWQIEDAEVDIGGYAPDSAHTSTALVTELIFSHSDDWFLFPVSSKTGHRAGHVVAIASMQVQDAFGRIYDSEETNAAGETLWQGLQAPQDWTLFKVDGAADVDPGLATEELILWHVAELPLESMPIERVQFGLDEESNLLWAVERTVKGREVESRVVALPDENTHPKFNNGKPSGDTREGKAKEYAYVPAQGIVPYWHPYTFHEDNEPGPRRLVQRRLVDLSRQKPFQMPTPQAEVLQAATIVPLAIPSNGIEVERRWQLARDMNGAPILWIQRQRNTLLSPPARRLRFDVMEEAASM